MRKLSFVLTVFVLFLLAINANAEDTTSYFVGKWKVLTVGTPNGDATSIITLERKDGKLVGTMNGQGTTESIKFTNVEEKENSVTVYFTASGYDVYMVLEKKDENHVKGSMMDMFDVSGERVKEEATN
jgi:hypothetical protein